MKVDLKKYLFPFLTKKSWEIWLKSQSKNTVGKIQQTASICKDNINSANRQMFLRLFGSDIELHGEKNESKKESVVNFFC